MMNNISYKVEQIKDWSPIYIHKCKTKEEYDLGVTKEIEDKAKELSCTYIGVSLPFTKDEIIKQIEIIKAYIDRQYGRIIKEENNE